MKQPVWSYLPIVRVSVAQARKRTAAKRFLVTNGYKPEDIKDLPTFILVKICKWVKKDLNKSAYLSASC